MEPDFLPERRRVIHCMACGISHPLHVPPGYGVYCGACGKASCRCGTTPAGAQIALPSTSPGVVSVSSTGGAVSLPTVPEVSEPEGEETRATYTRYGETYCAACDLDIRFCRGH